jgi:DnaJ-domain-containing protein 1
VTEAYHAYARRVADALVERLGEDRRLYTLVVGVQLVPVIEVHFTYNERAHSLYLYGKEEHVHPASVPSSAAELVRSTFKRVRSLFSRREDPRTTAEVFLEACIWICWADGYIHRKELTVLYEIVRGSGLSLEQQQGLSERLELPPLGFELRGRLPDRGDRRRCAKLCWQLVLADAVVEPVEEENFARLVQQLELSPEEVEAVKREAATELVMGS